MLNQHQVSHIVHQINYAISDLSKISNRLVDPRRMGLKDSESDARMIYEDLERIGGRLLEGPAPFLSSPSKEISNFAYNFHTFMRKSFDDPIASTVHSEINRDTLGWIKALQACEEALGGFKAAGSVIFWFKNCKLEEIEDSTTLRMVILIRTFCKEWNEKVIYFANQYDKNIANIEADTAGVD